MKRVVLFLAAAVMVSTVLAGFKYEGEWGSTGSGNGQFNGPVAVAAPATKVYVSDSSNYRVQYFRWTEPAVAPASLGRVKALFK